MIGRRRRDEDGSATVEMAVTAPVMIMVFLFILGMGRITAAQGAVESAANQAARAASIARTGDAASRDASAAVEGTLTSERLRCTDTTVTVDKTQFGAPIGTRAEVAVTVTCVVNLGDLSGITGLPGTFTVTRTRTSPVDTYRGRVP